jgi:acyl dehydratase
MFHVKHFRHNFAGKGFTVDFPRPVCRRVVNGLLVISIVTGMTVRDISENAIANLEYESIRHTAPSFGGDTLYAETTVLEVTPSSSKPDAEWCTSRLTESIRRASRC